MFPNDFQPIKEAAQSGNPVVDTQDVNAIGDLVNRMQPTAASNLLFAHTLGFSRVRTYVDRRKLTVPVMADGYADQWLTVRDYAGNSIAGAWTDTNVAIHLTARLVSEIPLSASRALLVASQGIHEAPPLTWSIVELSSDSTSAKVRVYYNPQSFQQQQTISFVLDTIAIVKTLPVAGVGNPISLLNNEFIDCTQKTGFNTGTGIGLIMLRDKPTNWGTIGLVEANDWDALHSVSHYKEFTGLTETTAACSMYATPTMYVPPVAELSECAFLPYVYMPDMGGAVDWNISDVIDEAFSADSYVYPTPSTTVPSVVQASYGDLCQDIAYDESFYGTGKTVTIDVRYSSFILQTVVGKMIPGMRAAAGLFLQFLDSSGLAIAVDDNYRPSEIALDYWDSETSEDQALVQRVTEPSGRYIFLTKTSVSTQRLTATVPSGTTTIRIGFVGGLWNKRVDATHPDLRTPGIYGGIYLYGVRAGIA